MKNNKNRFDWIDRLEEQELKRLLNKKELNFEPSEWDINKVVNMIKRGEENMESKKTGFNVFMKFAVSFVILIIAVSSILFYLNIYNKKSVVETNLNSCIVKYISGRSYLLDETTGERKDLAVGDNLNENAVVVTEADANVELEIADNSVVLIKEKSKLKTLKLFKDTNVKKTLLELVAGEIVNTLEKLNQDSTFEVETKTVTVGVRGTVFSVKVSDNNDTTVSVSKGEVYARLNTDKRVADFIDLLNKMNKEKLTAVYNSEKIVKSGETLEVKYEDYLKAENKSQKIVNTIKSSVEKNPDYEIEGKILNHIKDIREIILRIEKINEEDDKKKEDVKKVETKNSSKIETKTAKAVENKAEEKKVNDDVGVVFRENFENTSIGKLPNGWTESFGDSDTFIGVVDSKTIKPHSMPNSLKLSDNSDKGTAQIRRQLEDHQYGQVKFYFYPSKSLSSELFFTLKRDSNSYLINLDFFNGDIVSLTDAGNTNRKNIGKYNFDQWNEVVVKYDTVSSLYKVLCNNKELGVFPLLYENSSASLISFQCGLRNPDGNKPLKWVTVYLDDIEFRTNKEKITLKK